MNNEVHIIKGLCVFKLKDLKNAYYTFKNIMEELMEENLDTQS